MNMTEFPECGGHVRSREEWRIFNLVETWNALEDPDGASGRLEEELVKLGFRTRRKNGKARQRLLWHDPEEWTAFFRENGWG